MLEKGRITDAGAAGQEPRGENTRHLRRRLAERISVTAPKAEMKLGHLAKV